MYAAVLPSFKLEAHECIQVGNLSFYTTEEQIYELFSKCTTSEDGGGIKRIIMGLDRNTRCASLAPDHSDDIWTEFQDTVWVLFC